VRDCTWMVHSAWNCLEADSCSAAVLCLRQCGSACNFGDLGKSFEAKRFETALGNPCSHVGKSFEAKLGNPYSHA
jgi:hypothetical protein